MKLSKDRKFMPIYSYQRGEKMAVLERRQVILMVFSLIVCVYLGLSMPSSQAERYDLLIKNTEIVDGTGKAAFIGDIAIKGEKIVAVGKVDGRATTVIDGTGLVTCPGFIDPHSHADLSIMEFPLAENLVMQGITTFIGGNCSESPAPLKDLTFGAWLEKVEQTGISLNYAPLVGHSVIRVLVMGDNYRRHATAVELAEMKAHLEEAMTSGAFGFSSMRDPDPSHFADIEELVELAEVAKKYGGIYVPHTKHIQQQWPTDDPELVAYDLSLSPPEDIVVGVYKGYLEAFEVGRRAGIPVHIAHLCNAYMLSQPHPEFLEEAAAKGTLWLLDKASETYADITFDVIAHKNGFCRALPMRDAFYSKGIGGLRWVLDIDKEEFVKRLKTRELRDRLRRVHDSCRLKFGMVHTTLVPYWFECFKVVRCTNKDYEDRTIGEIARRNNKDPLETVFDIIVEDPEAVWAQHLDWTQSDRMNAAFLKHPSVMPSTDIWAASMTEPGEEDLPGPAVCGVYPNYIGHYLRGLGILDLEEGIRKATSFPAQRFGIEDRGVLIPGAFADVVVFDSDKIIDKGSFLDPAQRPVGIHCVCVNGRIVYKDNAHTGERPGKVLRHRHLRAGS
jgi:N-acyl-D-amino-acid deacylase